MPRIPSLVVVLVAACGSGSDPEPDAGLGPPESVTLYDNTRISSWDSDPNFQRAKAPLDLGAGPFAKATLVVDLASTCYPFTNWQTNPPPSGQRWPADCDAFDRNFEITLHDDAKPDAPPLELSRAITPFGGPLHLEIDITDIVNGRSGPATIETYIATWSDSAGQVSGSHGGWNVTAKVDFQRGPAPRRVLAVIPLVRHDHHKSTTITPISFTTPEGTKSTRLEYRVTGHGGAQSDSACIGPADEFCKRTHHVLVDGTELQAMTPWRDNCASLCTLAHYGNPGFDYCMENPCGAIQSVRAPRANWCPGSATPPYTWEPASLATAGPHQFSYAIDGVADGGMWSVSATFFAFGE